MTARCVVAITMLVLASCHGRNDALIVFAAASLSESLNDVALRWRDAGHPQPRFSFAGTATLARQIQGKAPADVLASADRLWMDDLARRQHIDLPSRRDLAQNQMVVVVPRQRAAVPVALEDLKNSRFERIGVAGVTVPAGRYATTILSNAGIHALLAAKLVHGDSVRDILRWVATGEVDAGFVYVTDARIESDVRIAFTIPKRLAPSIVYPVAVVSGSPRGSEARAFVNFLFTPEAQAIFRRAGFLPGVSD